MGSNIFLRSENAYVVELFYAYTNAHAQNHTKVLGLRIWKINNSSNTYNNTEYSATSPIYATWLVFVVVFGFCRWVFFRLFCFVSRFVLFSFVCFQCLFLWQ